MKRFKLPLILGMAHGVADGSAGLLLGSLAHTMPLMQVGQLVLLYNVLAFGAQPLVGLVTDREQRPRAATLGGLFSLILALLVGGWFAPLAVILAGLGSAAFHVGGGALALYATPQKASGPGFFAAPGVLGLGIGGTMATLGYIIPWPFIVLLLVLMVVIWYQPLPALPYQPNQKNHAEMEIFEAHDYVMMILLAAMALRSAVWTIFQSLLTGNVEILLGVAIAAAIGKILGGVLADKVGWRRWGVGVLCLAGPLLAFGSEHLPVLLIGIGLLQSSIPAMVAGMGQASPRFPATASGLALGLAIALGGLPQITGIEQMINAPPMLLLITLLTAGLLWRGFYPLDKVDIPLNPLQHTLK